MARGWADHSLVSVKSRLPTSLASAFRVVSASSPVTWLRPLVTMARSCAIQHLRSPARARLPTSLASAFRVVSASSPVHLAQAIGHHGQMLGRPLFGVGQITPPHLFGQRLPGRARRRHPPPGSGHWSPWPDAGPTTPWCQSNHASPPLWPAPSGSCRRRPPPPGSGHWSPWPEAGADPALKVSGQGHAFPPLWPAPSGSCRRRPPSPGSGHWSPWPDLALSST